MAKIKKDQPGKLPTSTGPTLSAIDRLLEERKRTGFVDWLRSHWTPIAVVVFVLVLGLGVFAKNGWLPRTDPLSGKKTGWFGNELPKNASTTWNPLAMTSPTPPPLGKEYIYAGSRLLAVADSDANTAAPADLAVWRPSTGAWCIYNGDDEAPPAALWGESGDIPVQGDYDGDGKTDFSYFRPSESKTYILRSSDNTSYTVILGGSGDVPVPADYDGDGKTDVVLWTASNHNWRVIESATGVERTPVAYGLGSDKPVSGDFDGDGKADHAYWRSSDHSFHSVNSSDGQARSASLGSSTSIPVCSDYDGDGKTDLAVLSGNVWTIRSSSANTTSNTTWYNAGDTPVPNDYDGDGKADIAVFHIPTGMNAATNAVWYILQSGDETTRVNMFGQAGDIPVPANYRR